jgi:hypothetical protein
MADEYAVYAMSCEQGFAAAGRRLQADMRN